MNSIFHKVTHKVTAAAFAFALLASPALAGMGGSAADGSVGASNGVVTPDAAGSTGIPGSHSVTGVNANANIGADAMGHSSAELPNNDAGTPINNGTAGAPKKLVPNNNMIEGGANGAAGVNGGDNLSAGAAGTAK